MIFATCGTSPVGFERMMRALASLPPSQLTVQHGVAAPPPRCVAYGFLPFRRVLELMQQADVVVSHAGVGSIVCAVEIGHVPIVFPRLRSHGETVDDHQVELAEALARRGTVLVARDAAELLEAVARAPRCRPPAAAPGEALVAAVRAAIHDNRDARDATNARPTPRFRWLGGGGLRQVGRSLR